MQLTTEIPPYIEHETELMYKIHNPHHLVNCKKKRTRSTAINSCKVIGYFQNSTCFFLKKKSSHLIYEIPVSGAAEGSAAKIGERAGWTDRGGREAGAMEEGSAIAKSTASSRERGKVEAGRQRRRVMTPRLDWKRRLHDWRRRLVAGKVTVSEAASQGRRRTDGTKESRTKK